VIGYLNLDIIAFVCRSKKIFEVLTKCGHLNFTHHVTDLIQGKRWVFKNF